MNAKEREALRLEVDRRKREAVAAAQARNREVVDSQPVKSSYGGYELLIGQKSVFVYGKRGRVYVLPSVGAARRFVKHLRKGRPA